VKPSYASLRPSDVAAGKSRHNQPIASDVEFAIERRIMVAVRRLQSTAAGRCVTFEREDHLHRKMAATTSATPVGATQGKFRRFVAIGEPHLGSRVPASRRLKYMVRLSSSKADHGDNEQYKYPDELMFHAYSMSRPLMTLQAIIDFTTQTML